MLHMWHMCKITIIGYLLFLKEIKKLSESTSVLLMSLGKIEQTQTRFIISWILIACFIQCNKCFDQKQSVMSSLYDQKTFNFNI